MSPVPTTLNTEPSYRTLYTLAVGGMGQVDLAVRREGSFERLFAIKRLRPELASESEVREMFMDEARIAGLLRHPNVVSVLDVGEDESGPFAVMDFVEGISVAQLLAKRNVHPLPLSLVLGIAREIAHGLHAAHELAAPDGTPLELVHRDVSPQNVLIGFDGIARVTDFGIAKALGRVAKTSTGVLKGKLGYISPEQLRFEEPDRRADLFALGVVLFEMLTGKRLYRSRDGMDGPRRILTEPPPDLADHRDDAEPELVALLFELLAKKRQARPPTARHVAARLEAMLATLTAAGESVQCADFLAEHFAAERRELSERIRKARSVPLPRSVQVASPRPRRIGVYAAVGVVAALGIAGAAVLGARARSNDVVQTPPVVAAEPAETSVQALPKPAAPPLEPVASSEPDQEPEPPRPTATSAAAPTKARAPRAAAKKPAKSGMPIWESY